MHWKSTRDTGGYTCSTPPQSQGKVPHVGYHCPPTRHQARALSTFHDHRDAAEAQKRRSGGQQKQEGANSTVSCSFALGTYLMRTQAFLAMVYRFIRRSSSVDLPLCRVCTVVAWRGRWMGEGGGGRGELLLGDIVQCSETAHRDRRCSTVAAGRWSPRGPRTAPTHTHTQAETPQRCGSHLRGIACVPSFGMDV